ncbi:hypothetical protein C8J57DRAFT_1533622 [Mycena rebaudengoi]|nr:hypothetical protein C8J57DRAFT_1533622 [Mycena rebaudengoi]
MSARFPRLRSLEHMLGDWEMAPEVACLSDPQFSDFVWQPLDWPSHELAGGWTRVQAGEAHLSRRFAGRAYSQVYNNPGLLRRITSSNAPRSNQSTVTMRLGSEEAEKPGFPSFTMRMCVSTRSWDDIVYAGIRDFHRAKGFDPYSQDVARELGYPLYEVCAHETDVPDDDEVPNDAHWEK